MSVPPVTPTPWQSLRLWPAWRGLEESLLELAQMLRRIDAATGTGSGALDIAEEITALLQDPESMLPGGDWSRRFAPPGRSAQREEPPEVDEIPGLLREVACWVADAPALLESPDASRALGQALILELPRWWQGRLAGLLFGLRQMMQGPAFRKQSGATAEPQADPRRDGPLPTLPPDPLPPRLVLGRGSDYYVTLPASKSPEQAEIAQRELLYAILRDHGPQAAGLHLLLLNRAGLGQPIDHTDVRLTLGLERTRALTRREKDERCHALLKLLSGIRVAILRYETDGSALTCARTSRPLWELKLQHYGQAQLEERRGTVIARGQDWRVEPTASALPAGAPLPQPDLSLTGIRRPLGLTLAILLARAGAEPLSLPNQAILSLASLSLRPEQPRAMAAIWQALRQLSRAQEAGGWQPDLTAWPHEVGRQLSRPESESTPPEDWERFLQAHTSFIRKTESPGE